MDLWQSLKIIRRRKWTAALTAAISLLLIVVGGKFLHKGMFVEPIYQSTSKILLTPQSDAQANSGAPAGLAMWFANEQILNELIASQELLSRVVERLPQPDFDWRDLQSDVTVTPVSRLGNSIRLFQLEVKSNTPELAEELNAVLAEEFVNYVEEISAREFANNRRFIETMVSEAVEQRDQAEEAMIAMRDKFLSGQSEEALQLRKTELSDERIKYKSEVASLRTQVGALQAYLNGSVNTPPWTVLDTREGTLSSLQQALSEQRLELLKLQQVYTPESSKIKEAQRRVADTEELYNREVSSLSKALHAEKQAELKQKQESLTLVEQQLNQLISSQMTLDERRKLTKLERQLSVWENNHLTLLEQLYKARVAEQNSKRQGAVTVLEQPGSGQLISDAPTDVAYNPIRTAAMAFPISLLLGVLVAFGRDHLSQSMRLKPRIEETLDLPVVTVIPPVSPLLAVEWESFKKQRAVVEAESLVLAQQDRIEEKEGV